MEWWFVQILWELQLSIGSTGWGCYLFRYGHVDYSWFWGPRAENEGHEAFHDFFHIFRHGDRGQLLDGCKSVDWVLIYLLLIWIMKEIKYSCLCHCHWLWAIDFVVLNPNKFNNTDEDRINDVKKKQVFSYCLESYNLRVQQLREYHRRKQLYGATRLYSLRERVSQRVHRFSDRVSLAPKWALRNLLLERNLRI
jgi:hypothetical protein